MDLFKKTVVELRDDLKNKKISSAEICKDIFGRIDKIEPRVGSFITLSRDSAIESANEVDSRIAKGETIPELAGIPIAIKDNICTDGIMTTCASKILENFIPPYNATVVDKLKKENMIIVGKTNMDEFAMGSSCENSYYSNTKNPHDLGRVPGGSSGGSAACVAAGQCPVSLGSDTGGSIRQPASFCGVVGLKPTYGTVSRYGLIAFASSLDQIGPFARCVEDAALIYEAISGKDVLDTTSIKVPDDFSGFYRKLNTDISGIKIAIPKEYFGDGISEEVRAKVLAGAREYEKMGAKVEEISLPMSEYALAVYYILSSAEASSNLARFDGVKYGYRCENYDNLNDLYIKSRSEGFGLEVKRRIMAGTYALSSGYYDAYYKKAKAIQRAIKDEFKNKFRDYDVILTPVSPTVAFKLGEKTKDPLEMYAGDICTVSINIAGIPSISIPCGFDKNNMPIGMQLIGNHFSEQMLFNVAHAFEKSTGLVNILANI